MPWIGGEVLPRTLSACCAVGVVVEGDAEAPRHTPFLRTPAGDTDKHLHVAGTFVSGAEIGLDKFLRVLVACVCSERGCS